MTKEEREQLEKDYVESYRSGNGCLIVLAYLGTMVFLLLIILGLHKLFS